MNKKNIMAVTMAALLFCLQTSLVKADPTEIKLSKLENVYYKLLPDGTISNGEAEVTIRVENPSEEEKAITIVDRISEGQIESFSILSGSPEPSSLEVFFDHLVCVWKDLVIPPSSDLELRYSVSTFKLPPILANISYYVNGEKVQPIELEGDYYIVVNSGDVFAINLTVRNLRDPKYVEGEVLRPPLPYSIEMRIPKNNFLEPECNPEPYMIYSLSDEWSITWIGMLEDEFLNISLSAKARSTEYVGEVELKAVRIQLQLDASSIADQLEEALKSYNTSIDELETMKESMTNMKKLMSEFSDGIAEASQNLDEAQLELIELSESLRDASISVQSARSPLKRVNSVLSSLESNLMRMMEIIEEIQSKFGQVTNISIPNLTIPIPTLNFSFKGELSKIMSRIRSTRSSLSAADKAFETMQTSLSEAADYAYNASLALGELQESLTYVEAITDASLQVIDASIKDIDSKISEMRSEMEDLSRKVQITRLREPFLGDVELRNSSCTEARVSAELSEISDGVWAISFLILEGTSINASEIALQMFGEYDGIMRTPPEGAVKVQVYENGKWVDVNETSLGVKYDDELGVLLYKPGEALNNGSNPLIDLMKNKFRIIVDSKSTPEVTCKIDQICGSVEIPKVRMITKVDNPYIALNMNLTEEYVGETPPPEVEVVPEERGMSYIYFILGPILLTIPLIALLRVRMNREMRRQLYEALKELEKELDELNDQIKEKKESI